MTVVCRSVCLSVSLVLDSMSRTEGHSKLKIGRREAHDTGNPWLHLEVKGSKVKVSRPINAETENASCLRNGKAYELQSWFTDGVRWPASPTCAMTSKVKDQGYNVTSSVWRVLARNSTKKSRRSTKVGRKVVRATSDIIHTFKVKRSKVRVTRRIDYMGSSLSHHLLGAGAYCGDLLHSLFFVVDKCRH